jgi:hypothetical protein
VASLTFKRALLVCAVAAQIAVPTIALLQPPPTRFGFQMYSGQGGTKIVVLDGAGQPIDVNLGESVAGGLRPELDWTRDLPGHLCKAVSGAARVTVTQPDRSRSLEC